jgi:hypothetical protein
METRPVLATWDICSRIGVLRLIERAYLSKHAAEKYNQYGLESIDFLPFW